MILDLGSFAFGSSIATGGGTPSWGTSLGQSQPDYKFTYPGAEEMILGMAYCAVPLEAVTLPLGKGGRIYKASDIHECVLASLFRKVYINGKKINHPFAMVLIKESSDSHNGRRSIKYSSKNAYALGEESFSNIDFVRIAQQTLGLADSACWFVYKFEIINQDELHMSAVIVDSKEGIEYESSAERKTKWQSLIPAKDAEECSKSLSSFTPNQPLQQIFYGAPGTGKSYKIDEETKKAGSDYVFRTTFHPDSDYSTFVGAYKPVMEEVETRVVPVVLNNGAVFDQNKGTLKEKKISYRFVKQAFTKAYIKAWKEFAQPSLTTASIPAITPSQPKQIRLANSQNPGETWILNRVTNDRAVFSKEYIINDEKKFEGEVKKFWEKLPTVKVLEKGGLDLETYEHYRAAVCVWYRDNYGIGGSADDCWNALLEKLQDGEAIEAKPNQQTYYMSRINGNIVVVTRDNNAFRDAIEKSFNAADSDTSVQKRIAQWLKDHGESDFNKAWERLAQEVNGTEETSASTSVESTPFGPNNVRPVYLIIEEINRGNCAQIFGDLFQLLDRGDNGQSCYPIKADHDMMMLLMEEFAGYDSLPENVRTGEELVLPPNLHIWATMNTSDQSLFPIDSAFKRRWDWTYVKIKNHPEENYQIKLSDTDKRDWWEFVKQVNRIIASMTSSADKQLGYFFCKADGNKEISADKFVSKVLFYLWNDVFKDYGFEDASLFRYADDKDPNKTYELTFPDFYDEDGLTVNVKRVADFIDKVLAWDDNQQQG